MLRNPVYPASILDSCKQDLHFICVQFINKKSFIINNDKYCTANTLLVLHNLSELGKAPYQLTCVCAFESVMFELLKSGKGILNEQIFNKVTSYLDNF